MISVEIIRDSKKNIYGFTISGHADYADEGKDIVCSAVSALSINTVNSVEAFTSDKFDIKTNDVEGGYLYFKMISPVSKESQLLLNSFCLGIKHIQKNYGKKYIKMVFKEV